MMRLFIATPTSIEVEKELARIVSALKNYNGPVKWVALSNIHLTLKFLGDTAENLIPQIKETINEVCRAHQPITTTLSTLGAFPTLARPRVYWVDLKGGGSELAQIADELDKALHDLGFEKENRPFRAHLTLGRVKFPKGLQELNEAVQKIKVNPIQQVFDRIILFKSTLTPRGSIYEKLHEVNLKS